MIRHGSSVVRSQTTVARLLPEFPTSRCLSWGVFQSVCNLFEEDDPSGRPLFTDKNHAYVKQDGGDHGAKENFIANWKPGATAGFKYFDMKGVTAVRVTMRGYAHGTVEVRTEPFGPVVGSGTIHTDNRWKDFVIPVTIEDGIRGLYFTYRGNNAPSFKEFEII